MNSKVLAMLLTLAVAVIGGLLTGIVVYAMGLGFAAAVSATGGGFITLLLAVVGLQAMWRNM
ncbi:hypothetical protein [Streptomyces erythrochromogenes]|uniref:hypothetical protein n=1 Tax=Streptomyces erythrochromogenes TaxID=285574 RepID=UPI0034431786